MKHHEKESTVATISAMLVDDHEIVRAGFRRLLDNTDDICVVVEASTAEDAYKFYQQHRPDVVIMDLNMPPGMAGLEAIKRIIATDPNARILVLTVQESEPYPTHVLKAGAKGYLTKKCGPDELINAVRTVASGAEYLAADVHNEIQNNQDVDLAILTQRELQIFTLLASGASVNEIAEKVFISNKTVHAHRSNILNKLKVSSNSDLIYLAIRKGVIDP